MLPSAHVSALLVAHGDGPARRAPAGLRGGSSRRAAARLGDRAAPSSGAAASRPFHARARWFPAGNASGPSTPGVTSARLCPPRSACQPASPPRCPRPSFPAGIPHHARPASLFSPSFGLARPLTSPLPLACPARYHAAALPRKGERRQRVRPPSGPPNSVPPPPSAPLRACRRGVVWPCNRRAGTRGRPQRPRRAG